jgi:hypothetical protein
MGNHYLYASFKRVTKISGLIPGRIVVKKEKQEKVNFCTIGIVLGLVVLVISILWILVVNMYGGIDKDTEEVTWVG